ncbi:MAG: hypothetical protein D6785_05280, partial [Planctomycetota bacterium]
MTEIFEESYLKEDSNYQESPPSAQSINMRALRLLIWIMGGWLFSLFLLFLLTFLDHLFLTPKGIYQGESILYGISPERQKLILQYIQIQIMHIHFGFLHYCQLFFASLALFVYIRTTFKKFLYFLLLIVSFLI